MCYAHAHTHTYSRPRDKSPLLCVCLFVCSSGDMNMAPTLQTNSHTHTYIYSYKRTHTHKEPSRLLVLAMPFIFTHKRRTSRTSTPGSSSNGKPFKLVISDFALSSGRSSAVHNAQMAANVFIVRQSRRRVVRQLRRHSVVLQPQSLPNGTRAYGRRRRLVLIDVGVAGRTEASAMAI